MRDMEVEQPLKIIVLGEDGSGKTTLCQKLMEQKDEEERALHSDNLKNINVDGKVFVIEVTEAPGCELYIPRMAAEVPTADGFILVFSMASRESFLTGKKILPHVWKHKEEKRFPIVVVANKLDLAAHRVVRSEEGSNLAKSWYGAYREITSLKQEDALDVFVTIVKEIKNPQEDQKSAIDSSKTATKTSCCSII